MFVVDITPAMNKMPTVELPEGPRGERRTREISHLEYGLQYVKTSIQEMIYNGRKTDQCGVIIFGTEDTHNTVNSSDGGYENVTEYISIGTPNAGTLAKLDKLKPSESVYADPIDAIIVAVRTQEEYLAKKPSWTRKLKVVTNGEGPIEMEDWSLTANKINELSVHTVVVGIDFDDADFGLAEEDKSEIKRVNEQFYHEFCGALNDGVIGTCEYALQETARPDIRATTSALTGTTLRLGDTEARSEEAIEIEIKTAKCTAIARPKGWKKFAIRQNERQKHKNGGDEEEPGDFIVDEGPDLPKKVIFSQLKMRSDYVLDKRVRSGDADENDDSDEENAPLGPDGLPVYLERVEKEGLVKGFKYGKTYVPCPDGQFARLPTRKGIDILAFFPIKNFPRELSMGEIQFVYGSPALPLQQVALSSLVRAMEAREIMAIARWTLKDGSDPKMGVLRPCAFPDVDCLLWAQMPFADDVRKYTFASLDNLVTKKGEMIKQHPFIPTAEQCLAMDAFVDAMDLMDAGIKNEDGERMSWFATNESYSPAVHRTKQAMFHCAVVSDLESNPLPPPHPDIVKYFEPPKRVLKGAQTALDDCKEQFKVKEVPKRVAKARDDGHAHALADDEDEPLLLDHSQSQSQSRPQALRPAAGNSDTEDEDDDRMLVDDYKPVTPPPSNAAPLPTPALSVSPPNTRHHIDDGMEAPSPSQDDDIFSGREGGRVVGTTDPLKDFRLAALDNAEKAVDDLAWVVRHIMSKPFASRRHQELIDCLYEMRGICVKEALAPRWNTFLREIKSQCVESQPGDEEFWSMLQDEGRRMSLISTKEAARHGGQSDVSSVEADEFLL
ncbi:SPOC domain-like protein [Fistulina hepatica ATCC 64428]|uniref:ATP-dependent DNA helicase II subunit 2 n=1 Tax=Fistulina hepatica ATCC 64428 TaxID=1128425 RepID=A0A0D7A5R3_9AGAR|nr:SPOC domain-like protein [Fistulina hepatica ATCC 64428]